MVLARSRPKVGQGYHGPLPLEVWEVVSKSFTGGIAVSSNYARERSTYLALAASLGWISTVSLDGLTYGRTYNATFEGVAALQHKDNY